MPTGSPAERAAPAAAVVLNAQINGLGLIRSLGRAGVPVVAADPDPQALGLHSRFAQARVCPDPLESESKLADFLETLAPELPGPAVLLPSTDAYVAAVTRARERLEPHYRIPFPGWETVACILDKEKQTRRAADAGVATPRTFAPRDEADLARIEKETGYPAVVKPVDSHPFVARFGLKGERVRDAAGLRRAWRRLAVDGHRMLVQEWVPGPVEALYEYCAYVARSGERLATFTARKLEQVPAAVGSGSVVESVREPSLERAGAQLLEAFDARGPSFAEFKRDARSGAWVLIELNPRTTHCNALSAACGVDFATLAYHDALGDERRPRAERHGVWVFAEQRLAHRRRVRLPRAGRGRRYPVRCHAVFAADDPRPEGVYLRAALARRVRGLSGRAGLAHPQRGGSES